MDYEHFRRKQVIDPGIAAVRVVRETLHSEASAGLFFLGENRMGLVALRDCLSVKTVTLSFSNCEVN